MQRNAPGTQRVSQHSTTQCECVASAWFVCIVRYAESETDRRPTKYLERVSLPLESKAIADAVKSGMEQYIPDADYEVAQMKYFLN